MGWLNSGVGLPSFGAVASLAPPYVEPVGDTPVLPPAGDPTPPTGTPTDPETSNPEPGIDPSYTSPTRIEVADSGQTAIRTTNDPATFGVAYIATAISGNEYWEYEIQQATPKNATFAVGIATLALPLNGIPGDRATEIAWWSDGTIRQNSATILDLGDGGALARSDTAGVAINGAGEVFLFKNCAALNAAAAVGTLAPAGAIYPFVALYSAKTRINMNFSNSTFVCAVPIGFYPVGQVVTQMPAGAMHHYDLSLGDYTVSGANIIVIPDQAGALDLNSSINSSWPKTGRTINGLLAADWDTGQSSISATGLSGFATEDKPHTIAAVFQADVGWRSEQLAIVALSSSTNANPCLRLRAFDNLAGYRKVDGAGTSVITDSAKGFIANEAEAAYVVVRDNGTTIDMWINGQRALTASASNVGVMTAIDTISLGSTRRTNDLTDVFNGAIGEVVLYGEALSDASVDDLNAYFKNKWEDATFEAAIASNLTASAPLSSGSAFATKGMYYTAITDVTLTGVKVYSGTAAVGEVIVSHCNAIVGGVNTTLESPVARKSHSFTASLNTVTFDAPVVIPAGQTFFVGHTNTSGTGTTVSGTQYWSIAGTEKVLKNPYLEGAGNSGRTADNNITGGETIVPADRAATTAWAIYPIVART